MRNPAASPGLEPRPRALGRHRPPAPRSVSREAAEYLALIPPYEGQAPDPALDDVEGWERVIAEREGPVWQMFAHRLPSEDALTRRSLEISGVPTFELHPAAVADVMDAPLYLEVHGGGLLMGGGDLAWQMTAEHALGRSGATWVPDYRMPPRHPYPAALDDLLAVYRAALEKCPADRIVVSGGSAGGNLAAALLLRARDDGLPMPAALVLLTPELDLTESGDSFACNLGLDLLTPLMNSNLLYAAGADLADPLLSPLFGDLTGFPPTLLQSGTRDLFLSNTVRMHRALLAAGVDAELHVFEAMPHGSFGGGSPEDEDLRATVRRFEERHVGRG